MIVISMGIEGAIRPVYVAPTIEDARTWIHWDGHERDIECKEYERWWKWLADGTITYAIPQPVEIVHQGGHPQRIRGALTELRTVVTSAIEAKARISYQESSELWRTSEKLTDDIQAHILCNAFDYPDEDEEDW